jgi:Holliday junction resolvase
MTAKRVDANQKEMTKLFRDLGISVLVLSNVGKGCPDLLLGYNNRCILVELKDGSKRPSARKLTPLEAKFFEEWQGDARIINNATEAIALVNQLRACK